MPLTDSHAYKLIESAHERGKLGHAFLITGAKGVGKRELASKIIQMLEPEDEVTGGLDLFGGAVVPAETEIAELESLQSEFVRIVRPRSKSRRILGDDIRDLEKSLYLSAPDNRWKVGVIIDADRMNETSANAFLKTLEEPPARCLLLMLTTEPDRLLPTILSRCVQLNLYAAEGIELSPLKKEIESVLNAYLKSGEKSVVNSLALKNAFELLLKKQKSELTAKYKAILKEESDKYKQTADRDYLKEKEEEGKAEEASAYLAIRAEMTGAIIEWVGDALRIKLGLEAKQFPESISVMQEFSENLTVNEMLDRLAVLEDLRFLTVETNVHENLSLEVSFIKAFS